MEQEYQKALEPLKREVTVIHFHTSAERLGALLAGDRLVIKSLGKYLVVSPDGSVFCACHVNAWVTAPLVNYIVSGSGKATSEVGTLRGTEGRSDLGTPFRRPI
jgi:hypothetical protein